MSATRKRVNEVSKDDAAKSIPSLTLMDCERESH